MSRGYSHVFWRTSLVLLYTATKKGKNNLSLNISTTPALAQKLALISAQQELQKSQDIKAAQVSIRQKFLNLCRTASDKMIILCWTTSNKKI